MIDELIDPRIKMALEFSKDFDKIQEDFEKLSDEWTKIGDDNSELIDKVNIQIQTVFALNERPDASSFQSILEQGLILVDTFEPFAKLIVAFYSTNSEIAKNTTEMINKIGEQFNTTDFERSEEIIKYCRAIIEKYMEIINPLIDKNELRKIKLLEDRKVLSDIYNSMIQ